jgi:Zn-dependent alcohol dehydrogenase
MQVTAAVVRERSGPFVIDALDLTDPRPDEVLVRVAASGMCATDLHGRDGYYATPYPCVFGHEGAGVVEAVGSGVSTVAVGDHVIMSFPWCGNCPNCRRDMYSHCQQSFAWKFSGTRPDGSTLLGKQTVRRRPLASISGVAHGRRGSFTATQRSPAVARVLRPFSSPAPHAADVSALGLAPVATAKAGRASIAACQRSSSE